MADAKIDVSPDRRLRGKVNFATWKRDFEREAKAYDVLELFTGNEKVLEKPRTEYYLDNDDDKDLNGPNTIASTQKTLKSFQANTLRYTIDYNNWKSNRDSLRIASKLLNAWVSDGIRIEVESTRNAKEAYDLIVSRYKVSDERARDDLLSEMKKLTIDDCADVTDYLNKLRRFRSDLAGVDYKLTDGLYATTLLDGLDGRKWASFKEKWDTIRAIQLDANPSAAPSIDLLEDRLHHEALLRQHQDDERRRRDKESNKTKTHSTATNSIRSYSRGTKHEDRSHLKCDFCGHIGHSEDTCWKLHPEKMPRILKDRNQQGPLRKAHTNNNAEQGEIAAFTTADVEDFQTKLTSTDSLGTHPCIPLRPCASTDSQLQAGENISKDVWESGGGKYVKDDHATRSAARNRRSTMHAFLAGPVRAPDVWLADSAANMHVVNNLKWFTKFHAFDMNINTADKSTALPVRGGGEVEVLLLNFQQQPIRLRLSNVAYAPQGRCNLLSLGLLTRKAGVRGYLDDRGLTLSTCDRKDIGYATLSAGLFYAHIKPLPKPINPFDSGEVIAATIDFDDPVWRMHRRLGHLSFQGMLNLKKASTGMKITEQQIKDKLKAICPVCATTRALVRIPRDPASRQSEEVGDLIHVDLWGPYPLQGHDGTTLFLLMTDDNSRFTWCERLRTKGQLSEAFRQLHKRIEKTHKVTIRKYRCDNEFANGPIGSWCKKHHISLEVSAPYAHHMNGVAERNMRTIREKTASMIQDTTISGQISKIISEKSNELLRGSSIPATLWPEAFTHSVWNKNRSTARALLKKDKKTPWEALYGEQPSLERERIWGSRAYTAFPIEKRKPASVTKLHHPRGWLGYFVGCESESIYRIYDPEKHVVRRIGASEVDDGQGLDDAQDGPSLKHLHPPQLVNASDPSSYNSLSEHIENGADDVSEQETEPVTENAPYPEQAQAPDPLPPQLDEDSDIDDPALTDSDTDSDINSGPDVTSKYFANAATKRKRENQARSERSSDDESHSSQPSDLEQAPNDEWIQPTIPGMNKTYRRYLPDDSKCNFCLISKRRCDRNTVGVPCTPCERSRARCIDQTAESQSLINPKDRNQHRRVQQTQRIEQDPPCARCYAKGRTCIRTGLEGTPCNLCRRDFHRCTADHIARQCHFDLTGVTAPDKTNNRAGGEHAVPYNQKCYRCATQARACNGRYPCNNCTTTITAKACMNVLDAKAKMELDKCTYCKRTTMFCNKERPCNTCTKIKNNCFFVDQGGLVTRTYKVDGAPTLANQKLDMLEEEASSDDECLRCSAKRLICSGGKPCYRCVRDHHRWAGTHIYGCNWRRPRGLLERYMVEPYMIDDEGRIALKTNHAEIIAAARARGRLTSADASTDTNRKRKDTTKKWTEQPARVLVPDHEHTEDSTAAMTINTHQRLPDPKTFAEAMKSDEAGLWKKAIEEEKASLAEKHTWDVVPTPADGKPITSKLVFRRKYGPDGQVSRHKARLVARGFQQEEGIDYDETFAAVVKPASYRILFAIAAILNWQIHQADVKTAFLNSTLSKPIHMRAPKGIDLPRGMCFLVLRAIYGLKQSPRQWYQTFKVTMESWKWRISAYDPCVFICDGSGLILQLHVDDITIFGSDLQAVLKFKVQLGETFRMTDEGECSWYLGMHVEQKPGEVHIHQRQYIDQILAKYGFENAAAAYTPARGRLNKDENHVPDCSFRQDYQSKVGSLNFAANQTRPDISFATGYVARYASNPNRSHMDAVDRVFAYLNTDRGRGIRYSGKHGFDLKGFVDSDFAGCEDSRRSTTGWVFTLAGGPISWNSQRQKTVATSTLDAEYVAGAEAAKEAVWIRGFINDLRIPGVFVKSVPLYVDCNSALKLTRNPEYHSKSKHIDVKHHFIRQKVEDGAINTQRVSTKDNLADVLTKALPRDTHDDLVGRMGMFTTRP